MKRFIVLLLILTVSSSVSAAEIPPESLPSNATFECMEYTELLISDILVEVQNGLGFSDAQAQARRRFFALVVSGQSNGYSFSQLSEIASNAIFQYRDMYLRPEYHAEAKLYVENLIADIVADVKNGKEYNVALKESYIRILKDKDPSFNPDETFSVDSCYRAFPAIDSVLYTYARKCLQEATKG